MVSSKSHGKRTKILLAVAILIVIAVGIWLYKFYISPKPSSGSGGQWVPIEINSENLPQILESMSIVRDLPDESRISLVIGNTKYRIEKDSVEKGDISNPDVEISLPEEYFEVMGQIGICSGLARAQQRGDLGVSFSGSATSLAWKYRALGKYKSCLGL